MNESRLLPIYWPRRAPVFDLKAQLSPEIYEKLATRLANAADCRCEICTSPRINEFWQRDASGRTRLVRDLNANIAATWVRDERKSTIKMMNLQVLCVDCFDVKNLPLSVDPIDPALQHLGDVNGWDHFQTELVVKQLAQRARIASNYGWDIDTTMFSNYYMRGLEPASPPAPEL